MSEASISVKEAVEMLYCGRCNVVEAAQAAKVEPDLLKRLLLEKLKEKPTMAPLQLTLPLA
jgi:hypothetical protein